MAIVSCVVLVLRLVSETRQLVSLGHQPLTPGLASVENSFTSSSVSNQNCVSKPTLITSGLFFLLILAQAS